MKLSAALKIRMGAT